MDQTTRLWTSEVAPEMLHLPYVSYVTDGAVVSGARADAILTVDSTEHGRRRAAGLGAVTGWRMLRTLSSLPVGIAIPVSSLPEAQWLLLQCAGAGIVDVDVENRTVTRRLLPAVVVQAAVARGRSWDAVLRSACQFAGAAQRIAWFPTAPPRTGERLWEAHVHGVGVWVGERDVTVVAPPEVFKASRVKPASWAFQEAAYAAWLRAAGMHEACHDATDPPARRALGAPNQPPLL